MLAQQCSSSCERDTGSNGGSTYIIPGMTFTCSGLITRWTAGGVIDDNKFDANPRLQIWREMSPSSSTYNIVTEISLLSCNGGNIQDVTVDNNLYTCNLNDVVPVQPGDILGVHLSRVHQNYDRFAVFFSTNNAMLQTVYAYGGARSSFSSVSPGTDNIEQSLPLIALDVASNGNYDLLYYNPRPHRAAYG